MAHYIRTLLIIYVTVAFVGGCTKAYQPPEEAESAEQTEKQGGNAESPGESEQPSATPTPAPAPTATPAPTPTATPVPTPTPTDPAKSARGGEGGGLFKALGAIASGMMGGGKKKHPLARTQKIWKEAGEELTDEDLEAFMELKLVMDYVDTRLALYHEQTPQWYPYAFPLEGAAATDPDREYLEWHLDQDNMTTKFGFPDEILEKIGGPPKTFAPVFVKFSSKDEKRLMPGLQLILHHHHIGIPVGEKIEIHTYVDRKGAGKDDDEEYTVWVMPVGTRLIHRMDLETPITDFERTVDLGEPYESRMVDIDSQPFFTDMQLFPLQLRIIEKVNEEETWVASVYHADREGNWVRLDDLSGNRFMLDGPRVNDFESNRFVRFKTSHFGIDGEQFEGNFVSSNPMNCMTCHAGTTPATQQIPKIVMEGFEFPESPQSGRAQSTARRAFKGLVSGPNAFGPHNTTILADPALAAYFNEPSRRPWPKHLEADDDFSPGEFVVKRDEVESFVDEWYPHINTPVQATP